MAPVVMQRLGNCGGPVPGNALLPVLVGDPVASCPTAMGINNPEVLHFADLVPSPRGPGLLSGLADADLPPVYRALRRMAQAWLSAFKEVADA